MQAFPTFGQGWQKSIPVMFRKGVKSQRGRFDLTGLDECLQTPRSLCVQRSVFWSLCVRAEARYMAKGGAKLAWGAAASGSRALGVERSIQTHSRCSEHGCGHAATMRKVSEMHSQSDGKGST